MGNGGSRDAVDVATLRQGLELIGRWALLLARKSPQMIDRWEELEERLQTAEADLEIMQDNMGRVTERLSRLEDREKARETRVATLETSIEKALSTMFPRVDALLTHLEQQNSSRTKSGNVLKDEHLERTTDSESTITKLVAAEVPVAAVPNADVSVAVVSTVVSPTVEVSAAAVTATEVLAAEVPAAGGKRKLQHKGTMEHVSGPVSCVTSQYSPTPAKRLAADTNVPVSATPSTSSTPDASPTPSTSSTSSSVQQNDLEDALLSAVVGGRVGDLRCLLAAGADVNIVNIYGQTPVALAASRGHTDCLSTLLFAGGAVNNEARDSNGHLPLHAAAVEGQVATLPLLLSAGADINARTEPAAHTPLMLAASQGHHDFVSALLQHGADVNTQDNAGETVLHKAVRSGNKQSVSLLLDAGVNVNLLDKMGCSPLHHAHQLQRKRIKKMLISAGARKIP